MEDGDTDFAVGVDYVRGGGRWLTWRLWDEGRIYQYRENKGG